MNNKPSHREVWCVNRDHGVIGMICDSGFRAQANAEKRAAEIMAAGGRAWVRKEMRPNRVGPPVR